MRVYAQRVTGAHVVVVLETEGAPISDSARSAIMTMTVKPEAAEWYPLGSLHDVELIAVLREE